MMSKEVNYFWVCDRLNRMCIFVVAPNLETAVAIGEYIFEDKVFVDLRRCGNTKENEQLVNHFIKHEVKQGYISTLGRPPHEYITRKDIIDEILESL